MNSKRGVSLLLVLIMILGMCGVTVSAVGENAEEVLLTGDFTDADGVVMTRSEGSIYTSTLDIEAGSYYFNIKHGDTVYGHPGTIKDTTADVSSDGFEFNADVNAECTFVATGGSYTFSFNTETSNLSVTDGTQPEETEGDMLTVNYGNGVSVAEKGDKLSYCVYLSADMPLENVQTALNYNSHKLSLVKVSEADFSDNYPNLSEAVFNSELPGVITLNSSKVQGYDFTDEKVLLALDFLVIEGGETALELIVQEMTAVDGKTYFTFSTMKTEGANLREELKVIPKPVDFAGCTITLEGQIAVNFHMELSEAVSADESAKMEFTLPNGSKKYIAVKDALKKDGNHIFTCKVAAKEMASTVKARIVTDTYESPVYKYSVKEYAEYILEKARDTVNSEAGNEKEYTKAAPLVKAMLNYGAAAQVMFNYNTKSLANESLTDEEKILSAPDFSDFGYVLTGKESGVAYYGSKLSLESETAVKHYFYVENDAKLPVFTVNGNAVTPTKVDGYYEIKISDILAQKLDEKIIVTAGGITLDYNAFSYGKLALETDNAKLKNVINALYAYNQAAKAY